MNTFQHKNLLFILLFLYSSFSVFAQQPDSLLKPADTLKVTPPPGAAPAAPAASTPPATKPSSPQADGKRSFSEKFAFGLGTGFWITTSQTYIEVSPMLAYRFPKRVITGAGYRYIYRHDRVLDRDLNSYGPNAFARVDLLKRVYFWTEYEYLQSQYITDETTRSRSYEPVDSWFAGLGYVKSVGRKGGISMQVLYNLLYKDDDFNPYYSAFTYRVGYFF